MIAAGNPHTAAAGAEVLRAGGNAVDAAVGAAFASFVAEPLLASAGGAGMMTLALPGAAPAAIDFFSTVPGVGGAAAGTRELVEVLVDFGAATQIFHVGRGSVAVPLALDGLTLASRRFGRMSLHDVVRPAVRIAREGVPLSPEGAHVFRILWPILAQDADTMRVLAHGDRPPAPGTLLVNGELSELLAEVGRAGGTPAGFHAGLAAFDIGAEDVTRASCELVEPLRIDVGEWQVLTSPRPGGRLVGFILDRLAHGAHEATEAAEVARMADVSRLAHRERTILTAPGSTTHVSVVDADGGAASITLTNGEGCGFLLPGTGSQLNNFLGEEDLNPHGFHLHPPGVRLPTMIAPTVALRRGEPVLAVGSGGANRIRSTVGQVLYRVTSLGASIEEAVRAPRVHAEEDAAWLELEGLADPDAAVRALENRFASVFPFPKRDFFFGGAHGVLRVEDGTLSAAADARRGGATLRV
jgi:gamma-glutamyltranspeptidase/glutathione hydrolase